MLTPAIPPQRPSSFRKQLTRASFAFFVAVLITWLPGCPQGSVTNGVKGKVTTEGNVVAGTVFFTGSDNTELKSPIDPKGEYYIQNTKVGTYKISVKGETGPGGVGAPPAPPEAKDKKDKGLPGDNTKLSTFTPGKAPPKKYESPDNGLTFDAKGGQETKDLDLKP